MQNLELSNMTREQLEAQIVALREAKKSLPQKITCKVSQKGAVSVYGLGRFPVTLYGSQWERLLGEAEAISKFIADNADSLAHK